jgi:hypothetical protein
MSVDVVTPWPDAWVLGGIFSYLTPEDVCRAAQVCRSWNAAQKSDWLWQELARSILDLPKPLQGSWKDQCRIFHCWKTGRAKQTTLPVESQISHGDFGVLEDNTAFELSVLDPTSPLLYSVRNLANGEVLRTIDLGQWGCGHIADFVLYGTRWAIVDRKGAIFQFDIGTGTCINQFNGETSPGMARHIHCNDREIVSTVGNWVQIWDLQQPTLSQFFEIGSMREIWHVRSTPNYVVCVGSLRQTDSVSIIAVNKKDHLKEIRIEGPTDHFSLQSYGVFCAFLTMGGKLCVWEDLPDEEFKLVRTISTTGKSSLKDTLWPGTVQMYRNWACVSKGNVFRVFDIRTGAEIAAPRKNFVDAFRLNGQTLLARHTDMGPFLEGTNTYRLYDFRERVRQLPLEDVRKQKEPSFGCPSM